MGKGRRLSVGERAAIISVIGMILAAIISGVISPNAYKQIDFSVLPQNKKIRILYPLENDIVGNSVNVRWETPYTELNHYILVSRVEGDGQYVQPGPIRGNANEELSGTAKIGTGAVGGGKRFKILVFATQKILSEGPLSIDISKFPTSQPVTVKKEGI